MSASRAPKRPKPSLNDMPDELLVRTFTFVADNLTFDQGDESDEYETMVFGPLSVPVPEMLALSVTCKRFNRIVHPLLVRTWKNERKDGNILLSRLLKRLVECPNLCAKVQFLWLNPWKPDCTSQEFEDLSISGLNEKFTCPSSETLMSFSGFIRKNLHRIETFIGSDWIQCVENNRQDALLALLIAITPNLQTLNLTAFYPSLLGAVGKFIMYYEKLYHGDTEGKNLLADISPLRNLERVSILRYHWYEDLPGGTLIDHEPEQLFAHFNVAHLRPFFFLPSLRVLECQDFYIRYDDWQDKALPANVSGLEELKFEECWIDDEAIFNFVGACKNLRSLSINWEHQFFGSGGFTFPKIGKALETQTNSLEKLHICADLVFFDQGRLAKEKVGTIGTTLRSLTKLRDLEVPGVLIYGYHRKAILQARKKKKKKRGTWYLNLSSLVNLRDVLPASLERLCINEWFKNISEGLEDFAKSCGNDAEFPKMKMIEFGPGETKVLEEALNERGVGWKMISSLGESSANRPR